MSPGCDDDVLDFKGSKRVIILVRCGESVNLRRITSISVAFSKLSSGSYSSF